MSPVQTRSIQLITLLIVGSFTVIGFIWWWGLPLIKLHKATRMLQEANDMPAMLSAMSSLEELEATDKAIPYLRVKARSDNAQARLCAVCALAGVEADTSAAVPELIAALTDQNVNYATTVSTQERDFSSTVPRLSNSMDIRALIHYYAIVALAKIGAKARDALPPLADELRKTHSPQMRRVIEDAMQRIGDIDAVAD